MKAWDLSPEMYVDASRPKEGAVWVDHRPGRARLGMGVGTKGSNGSNAHPKVGSSWPMAYP